MQPSSQVPAAPVVPAVPPVPSAPAAPTAPGAVSTGAPVAATLTGVPTTREQLDALRRQRSEISDQLNSAQHRRDETARELRKTEVMGNATDRAGLEQRLGVLDGRIVNLERDLDATGQLIAAAPTTLVAAPDRDTGGRQRGFRSGFGVGAMFMLLVALIVSRVLRPRRWRDGVPNASPRGASAADSARLARVEQAVEAIAIEVERVSEGQRFVSQLLADRAAAPLAVPAGGNGVPATLDAPVPARER